ncbi:MAG: glycosyltransferase family 39 protein [Microscillaceae bacterium]|nr:glycosyltransferase family 39 protein [Microscillaceae bacterium]MDW8461734.1 glycosyltransferase family 39 protein [Cytophagales bacterium]
MRLLPFVAILCVWLLGAWSIDVMDIDSSQYASIAKEMAETGNYLQVKNRGEDYLDKPPLLFWVAAVFFQLFGISHFVFRLPAILFSLVGLYATYRLAKLYYPEKVAYLSALLTGSCYAFFLMHHDLRTDTMLTAAVMVAIWQIAEYEANKQWKNLFWGFSAIAWAMLAKGPIGFMVPVLAFSTDFVLKRKFTAFFRWQWLVGLLIVALWLLPMCIGLYLQFDAQPHKVVNGVKGESGLYFYFWKQSFGRLTGENAWNNSPPLTFLLENFLSWSFLPWAFLFIPAFVFALWKIVAQGFRLSAQQEAISIGGFLLPFVALSMSKFQLPHYTFILHPLAGIITAVYIYEICEKKAFLWGYRVGVGLQIFVILVLIALAILLNVWAFPLTNWAIITISGVFFVGGIAQLFLGKQDAYQPLVWASFWVMIGANILINTHIYPQIFQYQASSVLAKYVRYESQIPIENVFAYRRLFGNNQDLQLHSWDFYSKKNILDLKNLKEVDSLMKNKKTLWFYTDKRGLSEIEALATQNKMTTQIVKVLDKFHVSMLSLEFLNPSTRPKTLQKVFFVKIGT